MPSQAREILAATAAVYASCASYRDRGCVRTRFFDLAGVQTHSSERPFLTAFKRPDRFRFESRDRLRGRAPWRSYIVWRSGAAIRTRWDLRPVEEQPESLALGLAGATGVSGGSAITVPALLLPDEIGGRKLIDLVGTELAGQVVVDGIACHHLIARTRARSLNTEARLDEEVLRVTGRPAQKAKREPTNLWIAIEPFLLRRLESRVVFDTFATTSVTDYDADVDVPINDQELGFESPILSGHHG